MGVPTAAAADEDVYNGKYLELCKGLNLDKNAASRAWDTYLAVKENYSLDVRTYTLFMAFDHAQCDVFLFSRLKLPMFSLQGDPSHWLACAIYVACRNVTEHTVGDSETLIEGNLVSLKRLLRLCNIR